MKKITAKCFTGVNPVKLYAAGDPLGQKLFAAAGHYVSDASVAGFDAASLTAFVSNVSTAEGRIAHNPGGPFMIVTPTS